MDACRSVQYLRSAEYALTIAQENLEIYAYFSSNSVSRQVRGPASTLFLRSGALVNPLLSDSGKMIVSVASQYLPQ